ncbi:MAG: glycosyltransferase [Burkholderiales bacterium]|nr:glycosyltransferase [Burkholderiales bacterium]
MRPAAASDLPLVSIVVPAYNQGAYLLEAVESALLQDYPRVELIVLDDGSTDATREVLQRFAGRFRFESHPNIGQAATLNKGWRMAKGSILSYLAADDKLVRTAVSTSVSALLEHPDVVMTYGDFDLIDPQSRFIRRVRTPAHDYRRLAVDLVCAPGPGVFFRRTAFEAAGPWNEKLCQIPDFEYWLRLGLQGPFHHIPEVLASYRVHDDSPSFAPVSAARAEEPVTAISAFFASAKLPETIAIRRNHAISNAHVLSARLHLRAARFGVGIGHLYDAFRIWPANLLRWRTIRLLLNTAVNRVGHKLFWRLNRLRVAADRW